MKRKLAQIYIACIVAAGLWLYSSNTEPTSPVLASEFMPCKLSDTQGVNLTCAAE